MSELKRKAAAVSVATVWTKPESPRELDASALRHPAGIRAWLDAMTVEDRLDLCNSNRVQTQILYGASVLVAEESEGWVKVLVPEQGTPKEALGYPGWVPKCQLVDEPDGWASVKRAEVLAETAWLYKEPGERALELSYLTSLPVLDAAGQWVRVRTPEGGTACLDAEDVRLVEGATAGGPVDGHVGRTIVEQGKRFLGLPYLWGGMSSFGYDCSGFAYSMHKSTGIVIPRDASVQARYGESIERDRLEPGDLLFFAHEEGQGAVHHVGIYVGDGHMIHSPESGKTIELVDLSTYKLAKEHCVSRRYWGAGKQSGI